MIELESVREIVTSQPDKWSDERTFKSADGIWQLRFNDPDEWHMGAYGWNAKIIYNDKDVSGGHPILKALKTGKGFHLPTTYQPWCQDEPLFVLHPWDSTLYLYGLYDRRSAKRKLDGFPIEIQWSPHGEQLAVMLEEQIQLLNKNADVLISIPLQHPKYEYPEAFWWPDGKQLLVVNRESQPARTQLSVFDSKAGALLGKMDFDPSDLLPYDEPSYSMINRDHYSLHIGPGTRSVGCLLDNWSRLEFDADRRTLFASVYRPRGPCEQSDGDFTCAATERTIEVTLRG